jgi:hypothetical protein
MARSLSGVMEPGTLAGVMSSGQASRRCAMRWRSATADADVMRGTGEDNILYATGWTISGLATLATIVAVWVFGI